MSVSRVWPLYIAKLERKGRTVEELFAVTTWLTGYDQAEINKCLADEVSFAAFFERATLNPSAPLITGTICGIKVEQIEDPLMQKIRYLDKLVDELYKGKALDKVLRTQ
jgi:hypothetical protein